VKAGLYEVCIKYFMTEVVKRTNVSEYRWGSRDECKVDFEKLPIATTNDPLVAIFKALPWHSNN
jgi:hypothetical protein